MTTDKKEDEQSNSQQSSTNPLEDLKQCVANLEEGFYNYNHKTDSDPENHKFILENLKKFSQLWKSTDLSSELRTEAQKHIVRLIGESPFTAVNFRTIRPSSVEFSASEARRILLKEFQKLAQPSNFSYADEINKLLEDPTNISKLHAAFCCLDSILHHVFVHKNLNTVLAKTFPCIELIIPALVQQLKSLLPANKNATPKKQNKKGTTSSEKESSSSTTEDADINNNNSNIENNQNNNNTSTPQDKLISKEGLMLGETTKMLLKIFGQALSQVRISEKLWTVKSLETWLGLCQFILTGIDLSSTSYETISSKIDFTNPNLKNLSSLRNHSREKTPYSVWWKCKKWSTFAFYHLVYRSPTLKIRGALKKHIPAWTSMNLELLSQLSTGKLPWIVVHWCFLYFHQLVVQMIPVSLPQVTALLQTTLLPILGFSNMEYDLFTTNLPLYIRGVRDHDLPKIDQTDRIRHDVVSLIRALIQHYPNYIYPVLFDYIENLFSKSSPSETNKEILRRKEGVLYLIQTTGRKILSGSQYCERIIQSFKKYFIPEFDASCDLIRARISVIFGVFMNSRRFQHQMGKESIKTCCEKMVKALRDPNLFVAAKTAEALYLWYLLLDPSLWQKALREDFDRILDIFRDTRDESIIDTAENLLGSGEDAVVECAPSICKRLVHDFLFFFEREHAYLMRTRVTEVKNTETKPQEEDDAEPDWLSEYFLNPVQSLIDLCCNSPSTLNTVVDIILEKLFPVFGAAVQDNPEIFQDFATMLSVIAFHVQPFRPELWKYFDLLLDTTLHLEYEPEHFSPMIDFMFRDPKNFFENEHYLDKVWTLISGASEIMDFWEVGSILEQLLCSTTELMNTRGLTKNQIRNLTKVCNDIVPKIVDSALKSYKKAVPKNVFEVLLHCIMCCFASSLPVFNTHSKSSILLFELWFGSLPKIPPRMKRLNLFALCGLFTVPSAQLPPIVQKNMQTLLEHITHSLQEIELLKQERNLRWTDQKIRKKIPVPRSPRKRAESVKKISVESSSSLTPNESNSNISNSNEAPTLPEDNPSLERVEGVPNSTDTVFAKLGITLKEEKKTEREYAKLFARGEFGYDDEDEEGFDDDDDNEDDDEEEEEDEEADAINLIIGSDEEEEEEEEEEGPEGLPFEVTEENAHDWSLEEDPDGSDHSSDMAVGMYHNHEDSDTESEDQEDNDQYNDSEDEDEDDDSTDDEDEEEQLSSDEALELEETNTAKEKKTAEQDEATALDKIDEMVFVYDALHSMCCDRMCSNGEGVPANMDLIGLLSIDDANLLKEYFEIAEQHKDQCLFYVLTHLKQYEDQIKRLPEDVLFKLQKYVIALRINLSDEEIQLLKFNQS